MAQVNRQQEAVTSVGQVQKSSKLGILHIGNAGGVSQTSVLAMDVTDSNGAVTTWYYWPNASGVLQYSSTAPTLVSSSGTGV